MENYKKPFLGAAYYPEDWAVSEIDYDISKMLLQNSYKQRGEPNFFQTGFRAL